MWTLAISARLVYLKIFVRLGNMGFLIWVFGYCQSCASIPGFFSILFFYNGIFRLIFFSHICWWCDQVHENKTFQSFLVSFSCCEGEVIHWPFSSSSEPFLCPSFDSSESNLHFPTTSNGQSWSIRVSFNTPSSVSSGIPPPLTPLRLVIGRGNPGVQPCFPGVWPYHHNAITYYLEIFITAGEYVWLW
jgi:hypothetical protein